MPAHVRRRRRLAALATTAVAAATLQTAFAPPAEAGQVGVTIGIEGSGAVVVVEGSLEDGGSRTCDWTSNQDHRVTNYCARVRNDEPFEAWVWLRPQAPDQPAGNWVFDHWTGCDQTRVWGSATVECAVHSGAFSSDERTPVAHFRDVKAPLVTSLSVSTVATAERRFRFAFAASDGQLQCRLIHTDPFTNCSSPVEHVVPEGTNHFEVRAVDPSGNVSEVARSTVVGVDTNLHAWSSPLSRSRSVTFDYGSFGGDEFHCALDSASPTPCGTGSFGSITYHGLPDGTHTFRVYARKGVFYDTAPATYTWVIDTVAPTTTLGSSLAGREATFTFSAPGAAKHECRLVGPEGTAGWDPCSSPVHLVALPDGDHRFEVRSTDAAGNVESPPPAHTWTVDGTAPETSTTGPSGFVLAETASVGLAASEPGSTFACSLDGAATPCGPGGLEVGGLARTTHVVTAAARDAAGNTDPTPAVRSWTVPLAAADLAKGKGWRLKRSSSAYGGAFLQAKKKGASLTREVSGAREVALVVGKGRKHGRVKVYAGSRLLGTVRLAASGSSTRQLVTLATFAEPFTGSVRIVVATKDRPVRIEGLGVATR